MPIGGDLKVTKHVPFGFCLETVLQIKKYSVVSKRRCVVLTLAASSLSSLFANSWAQDSPLSGKQIRLVAPFSPGGGVDSLARGLADGLQRNMGLSVTVENKPGAGGNIAANYVAKSNNANTLYLLVNSVNHYANPVMVKNSG